MNENEKRMRENTILRSLNLICKSNYCVPMTIAHLWIAFLPSSLLPMSYCVIMKLLWCLIQPYICKGVFHGHTVSLVTKRHETLMNNLTFYWALLYFNPTPRTYSAKRITASPQPIHKQIHTLSIKVTSTKSGGDSVKPAHFCLLRMTPSHPGSLPCHPDCSLNNQILQTNEVWMRYVNKWLLNQG